MFSYEVFSQFLKSCTKQDFYHANVYSLLQHSFQFSAGKDLQTENVEKTAHSWPCFPVNTQWHQGRYWCNRKKRIKESSVPLFKPIAIPCLAICLGTTKRAVFCSHLISSAVQTTALPTRQIAMQLRTALLMYRNKWSQSSVEMNTYLPLLISVAVTAKLILVISYEQPGLAPCYTALHASCANTLLDD